VKFDFAGLAANLFEFVETLFVRHLSGRETLYCGRGRVQQGRCSQGLKPECFGGGDAALKRRFTRGLRREHPYG
jgi:hypothetical protein